MDDGKHVETETFIIILETVRIVIVSWNSFNLKVKKFMLQ